jgi:hypothetical protein
VVLHGGRVERQARRLTALQRMVSEIPHAAGCLRDRAGAAIRVVCPPDYWFAGIRARVQSRSAVSARSAGTAYVLRSQMASAV